MPPLFLPEYPYRPDAPLLSYGPAFSEELARSIVSAIWHENRKQPQETDLRAAAGLTMLEAFHPRDQLECMIAGQGVAAHCAIMDNFRCAAAPDLPPQLALKYRASAVQLNRMFLTTLRELMHLQSRPLPPRPGQASPLPTPSGDPGDPPPAPEAAPVARPRRQSSRAKASATKVAAATEESAQPASLADPETNAPPPEAPVSLQDLPEIPEDIATRPDGTPGSLAAYVPKVPVVTFIPREAPIMVALATRPKPWRMVNVPKDQAPNGASDTTGNAVGDTNTPAPPMQAEVPQPQRQVPRGPVDLRERIFTGDALARFAATRLDPDAPLESLRFEHEDSVVELELISTGGDPSAEAEQAAMMAAHPEGKAIVTFRHGTKSAQVKPPLDR